MKELTDYGFEEKIIHPMSGYNDSYDYCKFEGTMFELDNGKFQAQVTETVYHGDERDEGMEYKGDISEVFVNKSEEFDTIEEAEKFLEDFELEYEGETELY